jgi:competence ComEA-like helix-hairpin-helix protein
MYFISLIGLAFAASAQSLPPGESKGLVQQQCVGCHAIKVVTSKRASKPQWRTIVDQMVTRGAEVSDDDIPAVVDYLAKNFGPANTEKSQARTEPVNVNRVTAAELAAELELSAEESRSIVSYREQNGNFSEWHDLAKVPGINIKKIEAHKDRLVF